MENITVYKQSEFSTMPQCKQEYLGYVYAMEFGEYVKIGCTQCPYQRVQQLKGVANYGTRKIGQMALSEAHVNYMQNEHLLHLQFEAKRIKGTELFDITLMQAINEMKNLHIDRDTTTIQQECEEMLEQFKSWFLYGQNKNSTMPQPVSNFNKSVELDDIDIAMEAINLDNETQAQVSIETYYQISNYGNELLLLMKQKDLNNLILNLIELSVNMSAIKLNNKNKQS